MSVQRVPSSQVKKDTGRGERCWRERRGRKGKEKRGVVHASVPIHCARKIIIIKRQRGGLRGKGHHQSALPQCNPQAQLQKNHKQLHVPQMAQGQEPGERLQVVPCLAKEQKILEKTGVLSYETAFKNPSWSLCFFKKTRQSFGDRAGINHRATDGEKMSLMSSSKSQTIGAWTAVQCFTELGNSDRDFCYPGQEAKILPIQSYNAGLYLTANIKSRYTCIVKSAKSTALYHVLVLLPKSTIISSGNMHDVSP